MRKASWIFLTLVGLLLVLASLASMSVAYFQSASNDVVLSTDIGQLSAGDLALEAALRARRGTSAAFAFGFAVLFLAVVLGPYRRGDAWAWWALLGSVAAISAVTVLRIPTLGTNLGVGANLSLLVATLLGLLLDLKRVLKAG